jgi:hypothetical protein
MVIGRPVSLGAELVLSLMLSPCMVVMTEFVGLLLSLALWLYP